MLLASLNLVPLALFRVPPRPASPMSLVEHLFRFIVTVQTLLELDRQLKSIPHPVFVLNPMPRGTARQISAFPRARLPIPID